MPNVPHTAINPIDRFSRTIESIHAMNWLLYLALDQGVGLSFIAGGVHEIFEHQCHELNGFYEHYRSLLTEEDKRLVKERTQPEPKSEHAVATSTDAQTKLETDDMAGRVEFYSMQLDFVADQLEQGKRIDEVAGSMNLVPAAVRAMVEALPDKATREAVKARDRSQTAKVLRKGFIEEKSLEGVDPSAIAQSLNLKRSTVERVIQQLQAGGKAEAPTDAEEDAA